MCIKSKDPSKSATLAQKFHEVILKFLEVEAHLVPSEKKLIKKLGEKYAIIITRKVFTDREYSKYIGLLIKSYIVLQSLNIPSPIQTSKDNDLLKNSIKKELAEKEPTKKESKKNPKEEEPIKRKSIEKPPIKKNLKNRNLLKRLLKKSKSHNN